MGLISKQINQRTTNRLARPTRAVTRLDVDQALDAIRQVVQQTPAKTGFLQSGQKLWLDGQAPGPDYTITTPFQIKSARPPNQEFAEIRGNQVVYLKPLQNQDRVATGMQGFGEQAGDYDVRVENRKAGVGLRITGDRPLQNESLWSIRAVLAVEPFIHVAAAPGKEFTWAMTYTYYALPNATAPERDGKAAF